MATHGTRSEHSEARQLLSPGVAAPNRDVRGEILAAAVELFYRNGYQATGVKEIVDQAGYTKGALYHYFASKEALLLEIHDVFMTYAIERGREIMASEMSASEKLSAVMHELIRQVDKYRPHMTVVLQETPFIDFKKYPEQKSKRDEWEDMLVVIIEGGISSGEFRGDLESARVLSYGVSGMCVWSYHWMSHDGSMSIDDISAAFSDVILRGLAA
ncbi:MAG: TetR/AcrR family transcriptional regulator [Actinomycetota bacterium]|nr:TetR/AcrR family transcriptional regulator [Actinomycetota bacterium]MDA3028610.1 TetR/AcrR family transcriptional regulator [Actinomycetota bacterium]